MKLTDILSAECIVVPLSAKDKTGAITELVERLAAVGRVQDSSAVLKAVLERERAASTAIGEGLAVPHGKSAGCRELVMALGRPGAPLEFGGMDGRPVDLIVLLASPPDKTAAHIQALSRVSRLMLTNSFRGEIAAAASAEAVWEVIQKYEP